jgi:hypothetical protein
VRDYHEVLRTLFFGHSSTRFWELEMTEAAVVSGSLFTDSLEPQFDSEALA